MKDYKKIILPVIVILIGIIGIYFIIEYSNWQVALGIYLLIWANNISNRIYK